MLNLFMTPLLWAALLLFAAPQAAAEAEGGFLPMLELSGVGILVVFVALVITGGAVALLSYFFSKPDVKEVHEPSTASYGMAAAPGQLPYLDRRTVALISAAAVAAVGRPVRVQRITFVNQNTVSGWSEAGRVRLHTSHTLR